MARLPRSRREVTEDEAIRRTLLLTAREGQVFAALDRPLSQPELAAELGMSVKTIETHITHIGKKLGWTGRANLSYLALRSRQGQPPAAGGDAGLLSELRQQIEEHGASRQALIRILELTASSTGERFLAELANAIAESLGVRLAAVLAADDVDPSTFQVLSLHHRSQRRAKAPSSFQRAGSTLDGMRERFVEGDVRAVFPGDPLVHLLRARSCLALRMDDESGTALGGLVLVHDDRLDPHRAPELILRLMAGRASAELAHARSERRLRSSEQRARLIVEHAGDIISRHTLAGLYTYVSPAVQAILGWRPTDLLGRSIYELLHPDDIPLVGSIYGSLQRDHGPHRVRHRARCRDGGWAWLDSIVRGVPSPGGGSVEEVLVVSRDETLDTAKVEARMAPLREREERYRRLIEQMPVALLVHDERTVLLANAAAASLLGWDSAESMAGAPLAAILDGQPHGEGQESRAADHGGESGAGAPARRHLHRRDGSSVAVESLCSPCDFDRRPAFQLVFHAADHGRVDGGRP